MVVAGSAVPEQDPDRYCPGKQAEAGVQFAHNRFDVGDGAAVWYCVAVQTENGAQAVCPALAMRNARERSCALSGPTRFWYCPAGHAAQEGVRPGLVPPEHAGVATNTLPGWQSAGAVQRAHARLEVGVRAAVSYSVVRQSVAALQAVCPA